MFYLFEISQIQEAGQEKEFERLFCPIKSCRVVRETKVYGAIQGQPYFSKQTRLNFSSNISLERTLFTLKNSPLNVHFDFDSDVRKKEQKYKIILRKS